MQLLREDAPATVDVLAERLGVSRRTVFRDLTTIRQAGGVVTHELGRGYRLTGLGMSEPPQLGASEALALTVLYDHLQARQEDPILAAAARPLGEMLASADARLREACRAMGRSIEIVEPDGLSAPEGGLVTSALRATETGEPVNLVVNEADGTGASLHRRVHSGRLERIAGQWYFTAIADAGGPRLRLALDAIVSITPSEEDGDEDEASG